MSAKPLCEKCRVEIREGDYRWTGHEPAEFWHYACAGAAGLTLENNPTGLAASLLGLLSAPGHGELADSSQQGAHTDGHDHPPRRPE